MNKYVAPEFNRKAFNCPNCDAFSQMIWNRLSFNNGFGNTLSELKMCVCSHCSYISYWHITDIYGVNGNMIFPKSSYAPLPHNDMPEDIKPDYLEARNIVEDSPRGASALLRLVIQKLCIHLGEKGNKIDDDIASLVKKGLSPQIQSALDIVRVVGNNSVHPGELSNEDIKDNAITLFKLVNLIIDNQITQPKEIAELYVNVVPENIRKKRTDAVSE